MPTISVGSTGADYATIQEAIDNALVGDIIQIQDGSYDAVSIDKGITLEAVNPGEVTINGAGVANQAGIVIEQGVSNVSVTGITVNASDGDLAAVYAAGSNSNLDFDNNMLDGGTAGHAFLAGGAGGAGLSQSSFTNNTFTGEGTTGGTSSVVYVNGAASLSVVSFGNTFDSNTISGNPSGGLLMGIESFSSTVTNNTFEGTASYAQLETFGSGSDISGNAFNADGAVFNDGSGTYDLVTFASENGLTEAYDVNGVLYGDAESAAAAAGPTGTAIDLSTGHFAVFEGMSIQAAVTAASDGDTVELAAGTFTLANQLTVNKGVTLVGAGEGETLIDASGVTNAYGISSLGSDADGVAFEGFTLNGPANAVGTAYGLKLSNIDGVTVTNVTVQGSGRTEVDLNTVTNAVLTNVTANGASLADGTATGGNGFALTNSSNVTMNDLATDGLNAWGGVALYPSTTDMTGLSFGGTFDVQEDGALFVQSAAGNTATVDSFPFAEVWEVTNDSFREPGTDSEQYTFYFGTEQEAVDFATSMDSPDRSVVTDPDGVFQVADGMSIQAAVDAASENDTIVVAEGTFDESVSITTDGLTLLGANAGTAGDETREGETIIQPTSGGAAIDIAPGVEGVSVNGFTLDGTQHTDPLASGIYAGGSGATIENNIVNGFDYIGIYAGYYSDAFNTSIDNVTVSDNMVTNMVSDGFGYGIYMQNAGGDVTGNVTQDVRSGIQIQPYGGADATGTVSQNDFSAYNIGIYFNYSDSGAGGWTIEDNEVSADEAILIPGASYPVTDWVGIRIQTQRDGTDGVTFNNNTIDGSGSTAPGGTIGYAFRDPLDGTWAQNGVNITGGSIENVDQAATNNSDVAVVANDVTIGGTLFETLQAGGTDDDELTGGAGADLLLGGDGDDTMDGGAGDDHLDGGAGDDIAIVADNGGAAVVIGTGAGEFDVTGLTVTDGSVSGTLVGPDGTEELSDIELIQVTNTGSDTFIVLEGMSIQAAVDAASENDTIIVGEGTFEENILIDVPGLSLVSASGRDLTTIEGSDGGGGLGTIQIASGTNGVTIDGFTIKGINGPGGIENGAVYITGNNTGLTVQNNEIVAMGDAGLMSEFGGAVIGAVIDGNIFSGTTFVGENPESSAANSFAGQFDPGNDFPRQLVVLGNGGGSGASASNNVTFTNNEVIGTTGGISSVTGQPFGNNLVTIDVSNATINENSFTGYTGEFTAALRARRDGTSIDDNVFDLSDGGQFAFPDSIFVQNNPTEVLSDNQFINADGDEVFVGSPGGDNLTGTPNDDIFIASAGNDAIDGLAGTDTYDISAAGTAGGFVDLQSGLAFSSATGFDNLTSIERVIGSDGNDALLGNAEDNIFVASDGTDTINGRDGSDTYDASAATDAVTVDLDGGGSVSGAFSGTLSNVENVMTGSGADQVTGSTDDNTIETGSGDDAITLVGGSDSVDGGAGKDQVTLSGNRGDYTITWDGTTATVDDGTDTVTIANAGRLNFDDLSVFLVADGGDYGTVQSAVDDAVSDDEVMLAAGTYDENVTLDESISIFGANAGLAHDDGGRGAESTIVGLIDVNADGVTLDGIAVQDGGTILSQNTGIYVRGEDLTVTNSVLDRDGPFDDYRGILTEVSGGTGLEVTNSSFSGWATGVFTNPYGDATVVVTGNAFDGNNVGLSIDGPMTGDVSDNSFVNSSTEHIGVGVLGSQTGDIDVGAIVGENDFDASQQPVTIYALGNGQTITGTQNDDTFNGGAGDNSFEGGAGDDLVNGGAGTETFVLSGNVADYEWAAITGGFTITDTRLDSPDGTDTVTGVETVQFANGSFAAEAFFAPVQVYDENGDFAGGFNTIQEAVDASLDDYTIEVAEGVYDEDVTVDVDVTLVGAQADVAFDDAARGTGETVIGGRVLVTADGAELNGFTLTRPSTSTDTGTGINFTGWGGNNLTVAADNVSVSNTIVEASGAHGGYSFGSGFVRLAGDGTDFSGNLVIAASDFVAADDMRGVSGIWVNGDTGDAIMVTGNRVEVSTTNAEGIFVFAGDATVTGNEIDGTYAGFLAWNGYGNLEFAGNDISNVTADSIRVLASSLDPEVVVENNTLDNDDPITFNLSGDSTVEGGAGDDIVNASLSASVDFDGGDGDDTFRVASGGNFNGGNGTDTLDLSSAEQGATVDLAAGTASGADIGTMTLSSVENAIGGIGNDDLTGGAGANLLEGGDGDDTLEGLAGNDTLNGGAGTDTASYVGATQAVFANLAGGSAFGIDIGTDSLISIESFIGGSGNDVVFGSTGANVIATGDGNDNIRGDAGDDMLYGDAGNDTIRGEDGADHMFGGDGDDELAGNADNDILDGGSGNDLMAGQDGNDTLDGGSGNDHMFGGDNDDLMYGGDGNDDMRGGNNADTVHGDAGDDIIRGGNGADHMFGGDGDDRLFGGGGDDTLTGGGGKDEMKGNSGADVFVFNSASDSPVGANRDAITDFEAGVDVIDLTGFGGLTFVEFYTGSAGEVRYNDGNGRLYADADGDGQSDFMLDVGAGAGLTEDDLFL